MKLLALFSCLLSFNAWTITPSVVEAPVDHVFVPHGFDNNDQVEVIVTGKFPNPCYVKNDYQVKVQGNIIKINVTSLSSNDSTLDKCGPLKVPFTEVIALGSLQGGDYKIIVNEGGAYQQKSDISVAVAQSQSVDENIYALVDYIEVGFTGGASGDAMLVAKSVSPCLVFDKVEYISNKKDVVSILPIMKKVSTDCPEVSESLEIPVKFNLANLKSSDVVFFVRTMEGRSVHRIISRGK